MGKLHSKGSAPYTSISIEQLRNFYGDDPESASSISEFWRGSGLVPDNEFNASVPFYPYEISLEDFYETTNETYTVTVDPGNINEGTVEEPAVQTFNLTTTNIPNETPKRRVYYRIEGDVEEADFDSPVPDLVNGGYFEVWDNAATFDLTIKADLYSDLGLNPNTGVPTVRDENCIIRLYTGALGQPGTVALGNSVDGVANFLITDSSLTWYANVLDPNPSGYYPNQTYEVTTANPAQGGTFEGDDVSDNWIVETDWTSLFKIKANNNAPAAYAVTTELDTAFNNNTGRRVTILSKNPSSVADNDILTSNNYTVLNGDYFANDGTLDYNDFPNLKVKRDVTFKDTLPEGSYEVKIEERGRFKLTETDGPGDPPRVLDTTNDGIHYCIFTTTVICNVTVAEGGGNGGGNGGGF